MVPEDELCRLRAAGDCARQVQHTADIHVDFGFAQYPSLRHWKIEEGTRHLKDPDAPAGSQRHQRHQSMRIWIGLDQKFTNSADSGLDWIQKCTMCITYLERQFLLIVTLTPEVLLSNLQLHTSSFLFTCRFYKVFGKYLLCCVRIGLDWIHILGHQLDWTGLGSVARGFGLDWIVLTRSIPYSGRRPPCCGRGCSHIPAQVPLLSTMN